MLPEFKEIAPKAFADRIKRAGIVNAMHDAALRRMEQSSAVITSTAQIISELAIDWTTPRGQSLSKLMGLAA